MPQQHLWRTDASGILQADLGHIRLVVDRAGPDGKSEFRILSGRGGGEGHPPLAAGCRADVRTAMEAAETLAALLEGVKVRSARCDSREPMRVGREAENATTPASAASDALAEGRQPAEADERLGKSVVK